MDTFVIRFIKASLFWFGLGVSLGVAMAVAPRLVIYRPAHMHMNLLGFVTMMIYGVAYHVLPRFSGHPLHSRKLAVTHWWVSNVGLALFVTGLILVPHLDRGAAPIEGTGAALSALGAYLFIYNAWRTVDGRIKRPAPRPAVATLPVKQ